MARIPAYILAGGRSRRMGQDKATLRVTSGAPSLAQLVASALRGWGADAVHLVGRQPELSTLGLPVVPDPESDEHHPLFGVSAALHHARSLGASTALIVPCDLPRLSPADLEELGRARAPAVAEAAGHLQPLLAKLPTAWAEDAFEAARCGRSAREFVLRPDLARVPIAAKAAQDVDTMADLESWTRDLARSG